jgi:hypothetical protein
MSSPAASARASRRDSCSSISASSPHLGLGQQLEQQAAEADRLAGQIGARRDSPRLASSPR